MESDSIVIGSVAAGLFAGSVAINYALTEHILPRVDAFVGEKLANKSSDRVISVDPRTSFEKFMNNRGYDLFWQIFDDDAGLLDYCPCPNPNPDTKTGRLAAENGYFKRQEEPTKLPFQ
ncbi:hypothetical protein ISS07_00290 [Candidatus Woesearchaeota archaeon]|nr:hypothetical protein [Candidatus Woesearchaeota archaeon]